jgi:tetratricopeptide (TPR) repeat protein
MAGRWERLTSRVAELERSGETAAAPVLTPWLTALRFEASQPERADAAWREVLAHQPDDQDVLMAYAEFLRDVRGDAEGASRLFLEAFETNPDNVWLSYRLAEATRLAGDRPKSLALLRETLKLAQRRNPPDTALAAVLLYAFYAHDRPAGPRALGPLKSLVASGVRALGWSFELDIWGAQDDKHPEIALLRDLAKVISQDCDAAMLDAHVAWRQA